MSKGTYMPSRFILLGCALLVIGCGGPRAALLSTDQTWRVQPVLAANSAYDDVAPTLTPQGLYFTSDRPMSGDELHRLYLLPSLDNGETPRVVNVEGQDVRVGAVQFTDRQVYFGQCYRDDGMGDCDLCVADARPGSESFVPVHVLPLPVNDKEWDHHPVISPDGATMLFSSERLGGHGGADLWLTTRKGEAWSTPVNIGAVINTSGNEISPSFSADGARLYFASDGRRGFGGFDLYVAERTRDGWAAPKLLPEPFNSEDDDIFLCGGVEADISVLASNREGSRGGYDLFRIDRPPAPPVVPREQTPPTVLEIIARNAFTNERIPAHVTVADASSDRTLTEGDGTVELADPEGRAFSVTARHSGFMNAVIDIPAMDAATVERLARREGNRRVITRDIPLTPVTEKERVIYAFLVEFDFDLFDIRPEEQRRLDSVALLLKAFPNSTVVLSGHTDSVGTVEYNIKLGYNRATEVSRYVATWLRGKEVALRNPMEIRTYGETQPVAPNSTEEGRQRNRRVEIAIIRNE